MFTNLLSMGHTQYQVVQLCVNELMKHGFRKLEENELTGQLPDGRYLIAPYSSMLFAFIKKGNPDTLRLAGAHTDFPMLKVKPSPDLDRHGYRQINIENYGGLIKSTWFDRPLGLAGKVVCQGTQPFEPDIRFFDSQKAIAIIPSLAPHLSKGTSDNDIDIQKHMLPLVGTKKEEADASFLLSYVADTLGLSRDCILDFDLYLYICEQPSTVGVADSFLASPRIDNLSSVSAIAQSLCNLESIPDNTLVLGAFFDNEEIGSRSKQGADSLLLREILSAITEQPFTKFDKNSFYLSVDVAHATHPNYSEKSDITNSVCLGNGVVLKTSASQRYVCDSESGACILSLCKQHDIAIQKAVNRSGMPGGQTLGPILSSYLPIRGCDIGIPVLAMHSACECMHLQDYEALKKLLSRFFTTH